MKLVAFVALVLAAAFASDLPIAHIPCGDIAGAYNFDANYPEVDDLAAFFSIPYGQAPVGNLRWMPPLPASCWAPETLNALYPQNRCVQMNMIQPCLTDRPQSEDCLNLDVYTRFLPGPGKPNTTVPVFFWIHGGGLVEGWSTSYKQVKAFALAGDAVVVAVSYRLAAFGFLAHESLGESDPRGTSGNYGILDIQLALKWVQNNIEYFGGDKTRVTVIGQSSGGTAILALLASPETNGLISGAISLSGSPNITINLEGAYAQNNAVIQSNTNCTGNNTQIADCLRSLSVHDVAFLFPGSFNVGPEVPQSINGQDFPGLPIVDGVTLTTDLITALKTGLVDVPLVIETMLQESDALSPDPQVYAMNASTYHEFLQNTFVQAGWTEEAGDIIFEMYQAELNVSTELAYQQWMTDISFLCGSIQIGIAAGIGYNSPVYLSVVARAPDHPWAQSTNPFGVKVRYAGHNWDYVLGSHAWEQGPRCDAALPYIPSDGDIAYGNLLMHQWQSITAAGSIPTSTGMFPINAISGFPEQYYLTLQNGTGPTMVVSYAAERCAALASAPLFLDQRYWCCN